MIAEAANRPAHCACRIALSGQARFPIWAPDPYERRFTRRRLAKGAELHPVFNLDKQPVAVNAPKSASFLARGNSPCGIPEPGSLQAWLG